MPTLQIRVYNTILKTFKKPPKHIKKRILEKYHLFNKIEESFYNPLIYANNHLYSYLFFNDNFKSHPDIPIGYYDYKKNDILYVRCAKTNKLVDKKNTILTKDGVFIDKEAVKIYENFVHTPQNKNILKDFLNFHYLAHLKRDLTFSEKGLYRKLTNRLKDVYIEMPIAGFRSFFVGLSRDFKDLKTPINKIYVPLLDADLKPSIPFTKVLDYFKENYEASRSLDFNDRDLNFLKSFLKTSYIPCLTNDGNESLNNLINSVVIAFSPLALSEVYFNKSKNSGSTTSLPFEPYYDLSQPIEGGNTPEYTCFANYLIIDNLGFSVAERFKAFYENKQINMYFKIESTVSFSSVVNPSQPVWVTDPNQNEILSRTKTIDTGIFFPFKPCILKMNNANSFFYETKITENKVTDNINGDLLAYSTNVLNHKVSFLKTPEEEKKYALLKKKKKVYKKDLPIYLGLELELEAYEDTREDFVETFAYTPILKNYAILKYDGSLSEENGLEITTIPATLKYHKYMLGEVWGKSSYSCDIRNHLESAYIDKEYGIHIHISRNVFTTLTLGKLIAFINKKENKTFIEDIAEREDTDFCCKWSLPYQKNTKGFDISAKSVLKPFREGFSNSRYISVNLNNKETVEIRIFKSSTNLKNIMRKLEFCEAVVKFAREASLQDLTYSNFINFIKNSEVHKKDYNNLYKWLISKSYIKKEKQLNKKLKKGV